MVRLLDEGTTVYRPAPAVPVADGVFRLSMPPDDDPDDEAWEVPLRVSLATLVHHA